MKRFVIATRQLTIAQERALAAKFPEPQFGWWHWLPNFWILVDLHDASTAANIRDLVSNATSSTESIVLELDSNEWSGMFTNDQAKRQQMVSWLNGFFHTNYK